MEKRSKRFDDNRLLKKTTKTVGIELGAIRTLKRKTEGKRERKSKRKDKHSHVEKMRERESVS